MEEIIKQNQAYLEAYAFKLTRCPQRAKDLYQDTLIRFIGAYRRGIFTYKSEGDTKSYLGCVMHNHFVNDYRKKERRKDISYNDVDSNLFLEFHPSTENDVWRVFEQDDIEQTMRQLPKKYYAPLMMVGHGYMYKEIADELGEPLGTIKQKVHRARKKLISNNPQKK